MSGDLTTWALPRIERLLPLDHDSLKQIIAYADSLSKDAAADHLKNILGDSLPALEFISAFNTRRRGAPSTPSVTLAAAAQSANDEVPRARAKARKPKANIHSLPARQVQGSGDTSGAYVKRDEDDYMAASSSASRPKPKGNSLASALSLSTTPEISPSPQPVASSSSPARSSTPNTYLRPASPSSTPKSSRTLSPGPALSSSHTAKVTITGGKQMHGSSTLSDLDSAIRNLELQTNPLLSTGDAKARQCDCMATIHPLLTAAPNCLNCGNIICVKQGLGPCISCGTPLLDSDEIASVLRVLKEERGKERQAEGNKAHKRADISQKPKAFSGRDFLSSASALSTPGHSASASPLSPTPVGSRNASPGPIPSQGNDKDPSSLDRATQHRDKLLAFQSQNAQRTTVHDEAADFSMPVLSADGGGGYRSNLWASPAERALELKRQQRAMREFEFNSRPEWERKKVVASIDVVKGKVVKRFVEEKFDAGPAEEDSEPEEVVAAPAETGGGAFSRNPLLGKLIRPVFKADAPQSTDGEKRTRNTTWRRVQDDLDDNEEIILDGGAGHFSKAQEVA